MSEKIFDAVRQKREAYAESISSAIEVVLMQQLGIILSDHQRDKLRDWVEYERVG